MAAFELPFVVVGRHEVHEFFPVMTPNGELADRKRYLTRSPLRDFVNVEQEASEVAPREILFSICRDIERSVISGFDDRYDHLLIPFRT